MENNKDLYHILELDRNCTADDIKKSYKKLVLKYHPDKCDLPDAQEKFIDVQNAYQILNNPLERKKYDSLNSYQKIELYDSLKKYIQTKVPNIDDYIKLFFDDEIHLKNYIEKMDLMGIYSHILERIPNINFPELSPPPIGDINIYGKLTTTFEERYLDKYRKIQVNRQTKGPNMFCIPLRESKVILPGEGEYDRSNNKDGDVIIDIELKDNKYSDFTQMEQDIYYTRYIPLCEYLYGGGFKLRYFDGGILNIKFDSFVERFPLLTIEGKGMPVSSNSQNYVLCDKILDKGIERGDLLIIIKIKDLEILKDNIKKLCEN